MNCGGGCCRYFRSAVISESCQIARPRFQMSSRDSRTNQQNVKRRFTELKTGVERPLEPKKFEEQLMSLTRKLKKLVLISLILNCPVPATAAAGPDRNGEIQNVVVIVLDALRADHLGCYGYPRNTSPSIDALAEKGVVFDRAIVPAGWTKPSVTSIFSSLTPAIHGVLHYEDSFPPDLVTLAEVFRENGYFTYGFVNNVHIHPPLGFGKGFDVYRKALDRDILDHLRLVLTGRYLDLEDPGETEMEIIRRFLEAIPEGNLVKNGGFETPGEAWAGDPGWYDGGAARAGSYSAHLDKESWPGTNFFQLNQEIVLECGTDYLFGGFVRTRDLQREVGIALYEPGSPKQKYFSTNKISGTNDWTLLLGKFTPQSSESRNRTPVSIRAGRVVDFQGGEFWVDDVFVIPFDDLPSLRPAERIFIYAHFLDPHAPYDPPPAYRDLFRGKQGLSLVDKYDGEIRWLDNRLGLLFENLESRGILDRTLLVITSDHGEAFGEHGPFTHGAKFFHEEVSRVPLIYHNPRLFPEPQRRPGPVESSIDLLPSLIDLLALSGPEGAVFQGQSYFAEPRPPARPAFLYETPSTQVFWDDQVYVKTVSNGKWKYITDRYRARAGDYAIEGVWRGERGVELTVSSPRGREEAAFPSIADLQGSQFFQSRTGEVRDVFKSVYLAAEGRKAMLFNLEEDPGETDNLASRYPEKVEKYQKLIEGRFEADRVFLERARVVPGGKVKLGEETRKELRALGYLN